jgi:hypothetical protein
MSSPIHHADDLDPALAYAPPWVRDQARAAEKGFPAAASVEAPPPRRRPVTQRRAISGDLAMARLQQQLALTPEKVPEPPFDERRNVWPRARWLGAVTGLAALIAGGLVLLPAIRKSSNQAQHVANEMPHVVDEAPPADVPVVPAVNRVKIVRVTASADMPPAVAETLTPQNERQPSAKIASAPPPPALPPEPQAAPRDQQVSMLSGEELTALVKRGESYLKDGDLASARLLLRRAAEAGSADAALALGATFDPRVITQLGAIGAEPDIGRARKWYEAASKLGSQDASQELAKLAQTQR